MTSTVTAATLTVTLTEAITLNGYDQGSSNTIAIADINEVSKRIVTATTVEAIIIAMGAAIAAGQFITGDVRYIRITNLDDTNHVALTFRNENTDEFGVKLDKGQSFIYNADLSGGVVDTMEAAATGITPDTFADLVDITAKANTASCDLEVFVASV